jgi:hypothetical protein
MMGLRGSTRFDLWPDPEFAVLPLVLFRHPQERLELRSPEVTLTKRAHRTKSDDEPGTYSDEGWDAWFLLFGANAHKQILKQELVTAGN